MSQPDWQLHAAAAFATAVRPDFADDAARSLRQEVDTAQAAGQVRLRPRGGGEGGTSPAKPRVGMVHVDHTNRNTVSSELDRLQTHTLLFYYSN